MYLMTTIFLFCCFGIFAFKRLLQYLHIFQQEEYDDARFSRWIVSNRAFDIKISVLLLVGTLGLLILGSLNNEFIHMFLGILFLVFQYFENDPRKNSKKKLALTHRAKGILRIALIIAILFAALLFFTPIPSFIEWIISVQILPFSLVLSNILLRPIEAHVQRKFIKEAKSKLRQVNPLIIGITGSYGKTSVKHILGHILSLTSSSYFTPASVNTEMGITNIIRNNLPENTKYFVVEMGAYGIGSISKLCNLTPPNFGIITSIGQSHYERFKSQDNVARAKFELAGSVLKQNGKIIIDEQVLEAPYASQYFKENRSEFTLVGFENDSDFIIKNIIQTTNGLEINISYDNKNYDISAPIFGIHHGKNIALAFAESVLLGVEPDQILLALKSLAQIKHRLEVSKNAGDVIFIDDAYNSNPTGFQNALNLLNIFHEETLGRRVLITPGMVELGNKHDEEHKKIGQKAAKVLDIALVVQPQRIQSFLNELKNSDRDIIIQEFSKFSDARDWLDKNIKSNDIVLIENDLPDLYESELSL